MSLKYLPLLALHLHYLSLSFLHGLDCSGSRPVSNFRPYFCTTPYPGLCFARALVVYLDKTELAIYTKSVCLHTLTNAITDAENSYNTYEKDPLLPGR